MRDKLIALLKQLSLHQDVHQITAESLAQAAHIPLDTVLQTLGSVQNYPALIAFEQPNITRERILSAAMTVFAQKGWQKTSLDEVAAAAGMTKGAIYWHFRNKNDLFFALLDARLQRDTSPVKAEIQEAIALGQRGEPMQAVAQLFAQAWARSATDHQWTRLYLEVMSQAQEPEIAQRLESLYSHIWHLSGEFVAVMQAGGLTRSNIPQQDLAMLWCVMFDGVTATAIANPQLDVQQLAQKFIPILWHGLAPKNTQGDTSC